MNFGHVPTLRFVGVKIFRSKSNRNLVILIRSSELDSNQAFYLRLTCIIYIFSLKMPHDLMDVTPPATLYNKVLHNFALL